MSLATLERAACASARIVLNNRKLRVKDVLEWSTSPIAPRAGEVVVFVRDPGVYVAVKREHPEAARIPAKEVLPL